MKTLNKFTHNFGNLDIYQKLFVALFSLIFVFLFVQNFIFSSSFDILLFRSIDDYAFQKVLRECHENIFYFKKPLNLFVINNYAYGWLFWIIHVVLTLPFYLISILGSDFLLISMARNISLFFMIGSCFVLFKISKLYTKDKYIPYFIVLFFMSYGFFAFSAMSFRSIAQSCFFCILTLYLTLRNKEISKKDLKYIAISLSACIGTKLSAALVLPLIAILLLDRFNYNFNKENFKKSLYFLKYLIPISIFFTNPSLFYSPFKSELLKNYLYIMSYQLNSIKTNYGDPSNFFEIFKSAFFEHYLNKYLMLFFILVLLLKLINDIKILRKNKFDFLYYFIFLISLTLYLVNNIKMGANYVANYFFSFSFILILSLVYLDKFKPKITYGLLIALFFFNILLNFNQVKNYYFEFFAKKNLQTTKNNFSAQYDMQKLVGPDDQKINILADAYSPLIYSDFRKNINTVYVYDNISVVKDWLLDENFDYILLNRNSIISSSDEFFKIKYNNSSPDIKKILMDSRNIVDVLIKKNIYGKTKYNLIYDKYDLLLFKKI